MATSKRAKTPAPTGYSTSDSFFASRFKQGGRTAYALDLSPTQVISLITRPNPDMPVESNREIRPKHAAEFANYFRDHEEWVIPGIILRSPKSFTFEIENEVAGTQFGILEIDRQDARSISILDGQHRILGFFLAADGIAVDLEKARENLQKAKRQDPGGAAERAAQQRIAELEAQAKRLDTERLSVLIYVEPEPRAYRQMFFDISDNALGITASVRSRFDSRAVVNRALPQVLEHPLLKGRVEMEVDRIGRKSDDLLSAKNVAEIIKNTIVGFKGRVSRRWNAELNENDVANTAIGFLDALTEAFPPLRAMQLGQLLPSDLRSTSLLGSPAFLRMLAGVYYELLRPGVHGWTRDMVVDYFKKLAPHVSSDGSPVYEGSIWIEHMPEGLWTPGSFSSSGRRQDLEAVVEKLVAWALDREAFLDEAPAPRPEPDPELTEDDLLLAAEEAAERKERAEK